MATRKKYKIVLSEKYVRKSENGKEWFQFPLNISGQLVAIQTIIPLDPYTEPDMEQVRKEAYDKGYTDAAYNCHEKCAFLVDAKNEAYRRGHEAGTQDTKEVLKDYAEKAYQRGLNDLWEAMQKAIKMYCEIDNEVFLRVFHDVKCDWGESVLQALFKNTPQHLIDSIREYEESKEKHTWIASEANEPSVDTTLICSECGYTMKMKIGDTPALNFCPKCGDCKKPKDEES